MLRCLAIDDEPLALELLIDNISKVPFLKLVATCENPVEAMEVLQQEKIDLIFLDIQMPGLTGLQFLQSMNDKPMVILITAYEKYALEGFNLDVLDYLVKPVAIERFIKACNKAEQLYQLKNKKEDTANADYFFVNADYSLMKIDFADVTWVEGWKDYVKIHLKSSDKPVIIRAALKSIEDKLPQTLFARIHKSYIVSIKYITAIRKSSVFIEKMELPIGDSYREAIEMITGK
jgi:DNA-binding LytR/AlgR family response regulator